MTVVELSFDGNPARLALRPAHRERLSALHAEGALLAAGPWADESGALLVFHSDDPRRVEQILADDPYYHAPGVSVRSIREWRPVVGG